MNEQKPITPVDFEQSRLPIKVQTYLDLDRQGSDPSVAKWKRQRSTRQAMNLYNEFSQVDCDQLGAFLDFKREYKQKTKTYLE